MFCVVTPINRKRTAAESSFKLKAQSDLLKYTDSFDLFYQFFLFTNKRVFGGDNTEIFC